MAKKFKKKLLKNPFRGRREQKPKCKFAAGTRVRRRHWLMRRIFKGNK